MKQSIKNWEVEARNKDKRAYSDLGAQKIEYIVTNILNENLDEESRKVT